MAKEIFIETIAGLREGLQLHLRLEDGKSGYTSVAVDSSGFNNTFGLLGDANWSVPGPNGFAANVNTNEAGLQCGTGVGSEGTSNFTVSAWIKLLRIDSNGPSLQKSDNLALGTNQGWAIYNNNGSWTAYYQTVNHTNTSNISYTAWSHAVWVVNRENDTVTTSYYENGLLHNQASSALLSSVSLGASDKMYLGYGRNGSYKTGALSLSDVRLWGRALAGNEIQYVYNYPLR